eukprot:COSAG05_NODE_1389_length_5003_cov_4.929853_4_plen_39_part_00
MISIVRASEHSYDTFLELRASEHSYDTFLGCDAPMTLL